MLDKRIDKWFIWQWVISLLIVLSTPFTHVHLPGWSKFIGILLLIAGLAIAIMAFFELGASFTPFVNPREEGQLVTTGIYQFMRHPMYSGALMLALGWSLAWSTILGIILSFVLFFILDRKANQEEQLLIRKYPEYEDYRTNVKKFIPFLY
jgi:protein-S-isoprenylcysteine O-methyltransferase Ste14